MKEEILVVGYLGGNGLHGEEKDASGSPFALMTVVQHERIVQQMKVEQAQKSVQTYVEISKIGKEFQQ